MAKTIETPEEYEMFLKAVQSYEGQDFDEKMNYKRNARALKVELLEYIYFAQNQRFWKKQSSKFMVTFFIKTSGFSRQTQKRNDFVSKCTLLSCLGIFSCQSFQNTNWDFLKNVL